MTENLNDPKNTADGKEDQHRVPLSGTVPWDWFIEGMRNAAYKGPFMMELVPPEPCSPDAIRRLVTRPSRYTVG